MNRISKYNIIHSYKTKDSSEIRELIHPSQHINSKQSVAEARVLKGSKTIAHHHKLSEEIYLTTEGNGKLYIQKEQGKQITEIDLEAGTNVVILPQEIHWLENTGEGDLVILCCCSPPYSHEDTYVKVSD